MNWLTNKRALVIIVGYFFIFLFSYLFGKSSLCSLDCYRKFEILIIYSLLSIPALIFLLITYNLKEPTFVLWKNFSFWVIPVCLIVISFFPTYTHGMDFLPIVKGTVAIALTILYSAISLLLILYKSFKKS